MNIDKNNWYILEKELTEEQYRDVAEYLVENYRSGDFGAKITCVGHGDSSSNHPEWDKVEVELRGNNSVWEDLAGRFNWSVDCSNFHYTDIMRYRIVKQPEQPSEPQPDQTDTTSLVFELKRTSELVKRFGEVTGADLYFGADGIVTIERDSVEYEIDFDKVSEQEVQSLVDALTTLSGWFKKKTETGGNV